MVGVGGILLLGFMIFTIGEQALKTRDGFYIFYFLYIYLTYIYFLLSLFFFLGFVCSGAGGVAWVVNCVYV